MNRREVFMAAGVAATASAVGATAQAAEPHPAHRTSSAVRPRLRVRDWGEGKPVVFLSGWALPCDFWQYQMTDLTALGFRCVAYDRRGHGQSDDPGAGYDFDTLADDLAHLLGSLSLNDVTLVAYSMGGGEAARYLARHGASRISRVVFASAITPFLMRTADNPEGVPEAALAGARGVMGQDFAKWVTDNNDAFWLDMVSPDMQAWGRGLMLQASLPALLALSKSMAETDFRPQLHTLPVPSLVIHGDKDRSAPLPLTGARTARLLPDAQLSIYEGAPHGLPLTHRERFNRDVVAFIGKA